MRWSVFFIFVRFSQKRNSEAGFSLIGVMVASVIGLIIATGITQLFLQMSSRLTQQENRFKRQLFHSFLSRNLSDATICRNTLRVLDLNLTVSHDIEELLAITPAFNFYNTAGKLRLKNEFGIEDIKLTLKQSPWRLELSTKELLHNKLPIYVKDLRIGLTGVTTNTIGSSRHINSCQAL